MCFPYFKLIWSNAWDLEDSEFAEFDAVVLVDYPN